MPRKALLLLAASALACIAHEAPAQGGNGDAPSLLTAAEQSALRDKLVKYLEADEDYQAATRPADREKANKARDKAKEAFDAEWKKASRKGDLLGSMVDLRAVMANCFVVKQPSYSLGQLRKDVNKDDDVEYSFWVPKTYKSANPMRTSIVLPGTTTADAVGTWTKAADYFASIWEKSETANTTILHVCHLPAGLEFDPVPDYSREGAEEEEQRRILAVWSGFGQTMGNLNVDRGQVFLDCGRGNSGFGLRFATLFPDRFAGLILRDPVSVDALRLGSIATVPVLLFKSAANGATVDALAKRLRENNPEGVTVVDATDEYPFKASNTVVEQWMAGCRRNMSPKKVVIEPNHDRFNRVAWADIAQATPLLTAPKDETPRLEVEADRATNRITVKATSVDSFVLVLNDDLVDLSKEFTVEINGKATIEKRTRSFAGMLDRVLQRRDWDYLFTVEYKAVVPSSTGGAPGK